MARFLSEDPWPGLAIVPQSLNRYSYVMNNPVNLLDPSGLSLTWPGARSPSEVGGKEGGFRPAVLTPTPAPVGRIWVCGPATPAGCLGGHWVQIPNGLGGLWPIYWGQVETTYWEYQPGVIGYRVAREDVLPAAWDVLTFVGRNPECFGNVVLSATSGYLIVQSGGALLPQLGMLTLTSAYGAVQGCANLK